MKAIYCIIFAFLLFSSRAEACLPLPLGGLFDETLVETANDAFIGTVTKSTSSTTAISSVFHVDHAIKNVKEGEAYVASGSIACGTVAAGDIWLIFHLPEIICPPEAPHDPNALTEKDFKEIDQNAYCKMKKQQRYAAYLLWSKRDFFQAEQPKDLLIQVKKQFGYELPAYALENRREIGR